MAKAYWGTILKRGVVFYWRHRNAEGKWTKQVLRDENGRKVTNEQKACSIVITLSKELNQINQITEKAEYLLKVAETKKLLNICKIKVSELEQAFFDNPNRREIGPDHEKLYHYGIHGFVSWLRKEYSAIELIQNVTEEMAAEYMALYWKKGISAKSFNTLLNSLSIAFRLFLKEDEPFRNIPRKSGMSQERYPFSIEQLKSIWKLLSSEDFYLPDKEEMKVLYILALNTGLRCGDICQLRWNTVNMEHRTITLMPSKTSHSSGKKVVIPVNQCAYDALTALERSGDNVLPNVAKRYKKSSATIYYLTRAMLEQAGIKTTEKSDDRHRSVAIVRYGFHSFRHTFASMLIEQGASQTAVSRLLGHTTLAMTDRYVHIGDQTKIKAVEALPSLVLSPSHAPKTPSVTVPLEDQLHHLTDEQSEKLGHWLEHNLSDEQREKLRRFMDAGM